MDLQPNCGSDRAWVWKADDYADEALKRETLAIRFANAENAKKFKEAFEDCQSKLDKSTDEQESNKLAKELEGLQVKESSEEKSNKSEESEPVCEVKKTAESETSEIAPSEESKEPSSSGAE
ncbi:PREDICTED: ran-specific GTPase-activating protein-like [Acropora digitifera]|uniref:ran-specific GTPase-activating protein-like n=1 Tax=Acropora digitifera TaxID=70779 RepID=UPI00077AB4B5|nr:PREDICTED: ran-specific GTPase-activating protein-like [Acropora digitifera]